MPQWVNHGGGKWSHRPWWKVAVNTILRSFQPQAHKWVVFTCADKTTTPPIAVGYGFGRIFHEPR